MTRRGSELDTCRKISEPGRERERESQSYFVSRYVIACGLRPTYFRLLETNGEIITSWSGGRGRERTAGKAKKSSPTTTARYIAQAYRISTWQEAKGNLATALGWRETSFLSFFPPLIRPFIVTLTRRDKPTLYISICLLITSIAQMHFFISFFNIFRQKVFYFQNEYYNSCRFVYLVVFGFFGKKQFF